MLHPAPTLFPSPTLYPGRADTPTTPRWDMTPSSNWPTSTVVDRWVVDPANRWELVR